MSEDTQKKQKQSSTASNLGYAAGGFIAGAATGSAVSAAAQNYKGDETNEDNGQGNNVVPTQPENNTTDEIQTTVEEPQPQEPQPQEPQPQEPQPQEPSEVVETSLYAPIAHVSDNQTFAQAFAEARRQVGPGGVFEWRGNVYGTYYAEEWERMSAAERAEYHSHIDYQAAHDEHVAYFGNETHHNPQPNPNPNPDDGKVKPNETRTDVDPDDPVKVQTIQQVDCEYGKDGKAIIAEVTIDGEPAIMMDLNNDGRFDALIMDLDNNGMLSENEVIDIRDLNVELVDLAGKYNGQIQVVVNGQPYTGGEIGFPSEDPAIADLDDYHNNEDVIV